MNTELGDLDQEFLNMSIEVAEEAYSKGNYPVGAVLVINDQVIDKAGNEINQNKSFVSHAENSLILKNGMELYSAWEEGKEISLYSTLEPCIQCLGASVTNHINRIVFIQKDPNGGACDLRHDNIGLWYKKVWPEIIYSPTSTKPLELMIKFFKEEIVKGNTAWPEKMLNLLDKYSSQQDKKL